MSELLIIQSALERTARRRRWARALRGLWHGLLVGAVISLLLVAAYHLLPLPVWTMLAAAFIPFPFVLGGLLIGGWRKPSMNEIARWVDGRQRLQERLSTALEIGSDANAGRWGDLVVADAAQHARNLDPRRLMAFHLPRSTRWALVCLALVAGLGFVPEYRSKSYLQKKADEQHIKEAGKQLVELTRHSLENRTPVLPTTHTNLEAVSAVGMELTKQPLTRSEALKDLANVAEQLKDQVKELGKDPSLKRLERAARSASGSDSQTSASLQKQIESLKKQLGTPVANPDAMEKMKKELEKLQEAAKSMSGQNSPGDDAQKQKMAESLTALSKQVQDMGLNMPQIDDAIAALAANQTDLFLKDLEAATKDLQKMQDMAKSLQQMQQQAEKLGKDLAEQLKNGQPELAQQTLQKMISQLNQSQIPPQDLKKIMDEVTKAVDPAGNYGKVAQHLKNAAKQMQNSNTSGAAQSLAQASKELGDLMQQLADAQQLESELNALNEASQAIGTGQGWRNSYGRPNAGKGGRPGSGVGTWADEGAEWDGTVTAGWDNSGVVREDEDPRGHTDRGEGELSDALKPTKVPAQFTPGAPMPSITLKGVSIKGTSKLDYEAAAAAAQSDAQSALSHEKVPRAYQGAVRDYFDDLKK